MVRMLPLQALARQPRRGYRPAMPRTQHQIWLSVSVERRR